MKFEFEKKMHIMSDLVNYCHMLGGNDFKIEMSTKEGIFHCHIYCLVPQLPDEILDELIRDLSIPRQKEIEQNFWGLSGELDPETELTLVGMMVDRAEVEYKDGQLRVHCLRVE